jgi:chromosomal replication initiator protein
LGFDTVQKWLRSLKVLKFDACNLYLEAKDTFQAMWFEEHIRQKTHLKLLNNNKKRIKVHLSLANSPQSQPKTKNKKPPHSPALETPPFFLEFDALDPHCTFDHFALAETNRLPWKLLCDLSGYPSGIESNSPLAELNTYNPIYIYGSSGSGKTHLLMSVAHALRKRELSVLYVRAETFTQHVVSAIREGGMSFFRQTYRNTDVLLIDDVHVFSRKGATQEELFHTYNTLHLAGKQIILASNCSPAELQFIEPRVVSRFEWGIVLEIDSFKREDISLVLEKKADALNYQLHPKISSFLLETFHRSTKSLIKALKALILRSHLHQENGRYLQSQPPVPMIKTLLADLIQEENQMALTPEKIIQTVSACFGICKEDILGKAQSRDCVLPRQIAMYLCRHELKMPFMKIGDMFSKDHSTVMTSVKLIQKSVEQGNRDITGSLDSIKKKFALA